MNSPINGFLVLFALLTIFCSTLKAQLLNNTRWRSFDDQNNFDLFWNFNNDTVAFSVDNSIWSFVSVYSEVGNILTFRNINSSECDSTVIGVYHFSLLLDTLRITEYNETCTTRADYFNTHYLVDFPIGINELESFKNINIYPLPFSQELNIKTDGGSFDFTLLDITGRKLIVKAFYDHMKLETENLAPGSYLYEILNKDGIVKSGTIVKH